MVEIQTVEVQLIDSLLKVNKLDKVIINKNNIVSIKKGFNKIKCSASIAIETMQDEDSPTNDMYEVKMTNGDIYYTLEDDLNKLKQAI